MPKRQLAIVAAGLVVLAVVITVVFLLPARNKIERASKTELNTAHHEEEGGTWENGVSATRILWRFVSHRELSGIRAEARQEVGRHVVQGAYAIVWKNSTNRKFKVEYQLGFLDSEDLELAWIKPKEFTLLPSAEKETGGIFTIKVDNISVANLASEMTISSSFEDMSEQQGP